MSSKAVVLLSGGIDSATCLGIAAGNHDEVIPVFVHYGQQTADLEHHMALNQRGHFAAESSAKIDTMRAIDYEPVMRFFSGGVASDRDSFTTEDGDLTEDDGRSTGYQPMRNLHLIATAAGIADVEGADAVYHGAQGGDEEAYPDCRPGFMNAAQEAVTQSLADGDDIEVKTPLLDLSKKQVIELGEVKGVDWEWTYSCYQETESLVPDPCGECPACEERAEAFGEVGIEDPHAVEEK